MSNYSKLYWLTRLDSIQMLFIFLMIFSAIAILVFFITITTECYDEDDYEKFNKKYGWIKKTAFTVLFSMAAFLTFLPNRNEAILIMAGGKVLDFAQQDTSLSKIPSQTTAIISEYMDKQLKEIKKSK